MSFALAVGGNAIYAGGNFANIGGQVHPCIASLSVGTVDVPLASETNLLRLSAPVPSPVVGRARIGFALPGEAVVTLEVYDLAGRRVAIPLDRSRVQGGVHHVELNTEGWSAGCYWYRLTAGNQSLTRMMAVIK